MGNCTTKAKKPPKAYTTRLPVSQSRAMPIKTSEEYSFLVKISHIKLRGLPQGCYRLRLTWGSSHFETEEMSGSEIKIKQEWEFSVTATLEMMQSGWLNAELMDGKQGKMLARVSICQWTLAVGPSYQNFALVDAKKQVIGRLGMDVKVLQRTALQISALQIDCSFTHEEYGRFSLTIRRCEHSESIESHISPSSTWSFQDHPLTLTLDTNVEELRTDSIQLRVWRHKKHEEEPVMAGECWLSLSRLVKDSRFQMLYQELKKTLEDETSETYNPEVIMSREAAHMEKSFQEKLWSSGRQIGTITGQFSFANIPCITQQISGVNTEDGIQIQSTNFVERSSATTVMFQKMALPAALASISGLVDQLKEFVLAGFSKPTQSRTQDIRNHIGKVGELIEHLRQTEKETMVAHVYTGEMELLTAQSIFLDLGEHLLHYADKVAYEVRGWYYECLCHLTRRGELDLGHMSLQKKGGVKDKRIKLAVRYRRFLRKLLTCAIAKMNVKGVEPRVQEFTETILALSYFRIPEFKDKLLDCLKRKSFYPVDEWRGTTFDLEVDVTVHPTYLSMLDWQQHFYHHLPEENNPEYEAVITEERWQSRMEKRGIAYFRFISQWANDVKRLFVHQNVPWQDIPGYNIILKSFLLELKERRVENYSEALITAAKSLLRSPSILSVFVVVVFSKTNLHNFKDVIESLKVISSWFSIIYERQTSLPATFVSIFFIQALRSILSDERALNIAHGFKLIYRNYQVFSPDMKQQLVADLLLSEAAYRYMFHWSQVVRKGFWELLLYRLQSLETLPVVNMTEVDERCRVKAGELIAFLDSVEVDTCEKIAGDMKAYVQLSRGELRDLQGEYEKWVKEKELEAAREPKKTGKYSGFDTFPYPDQPIEGNFEDEFERKLEEEW